MPTPNSRLFLLLVLVMRIVLAIQFVADLEAEVWSQILTFVQTLSTLVRILKLKFRRDFEAEVWSIFCC